MFRTESSTSNNPIYFLGFYLGVAIGLFLYLKGWHPFWWLPSLFGLTTESLLILDMLGGGLLGYILHIIYRVYRGNGVEKIESVKIKSINKRG